MSGVPPMGPPNDTSRVCSRLLGHDSDGEVLCGKPATEHIIYWWSGAGYDHGFNCAQHWAEYQGLWSCAGHHAVNSACGMPGSLVHPERPCFFDGLLTAEPVRAVAASVAV